jgi:hypothetical protein
MPSGTICADLRARVREQAGNRCGYCLTRQEYVPWTLEVEHIIPRSKGEQIMKKISGWPAILVTCSKATKPIAAIR